MSANLTELDICNKALLRLSANQVESPDGRVATITTESLEAKLCIANWQIIRDICTEDRVWSFALEKVILDTPDPTPPAFGYGMRFEIPADALNVWRVERNSSTGINTSSENRYKIQDPWLLNKRFLEIDLAVCYVTYIQRLTDVTILDASPQFVDALSIRLAIEMCMPLTENINILDQLIKEYEFRLKGANAIDGGQATHEVIRSNLISKVR